MSEWISVKKKLPEPNNFIVYAVLTNDPTLYRQQMAYYSVEKKWIIEQDKRSIKVTHWFKLPEWP